LQRYSWPGNVRELRNVVERLLLLADGPVDAGSVHIALPQIDAAPAGAPAVSPARLEGPLSLRVDAFERDQILTELKRHNQRMTDTARALGLERSHLYKKCQALGIDLRALRSENL
jgi:two-component system nitrogen regulation response regulator NtrX